MGLIKYIVGLVFVLVLIVVIGWVGLNIWSCVMDKPTTGQADVPEMPEVAEASHSVYIENTGNLLLASDYEVFGDEAGNRVFILHGFWEMRGQEFVYKDSDLILDEGIFGEITIKRR